jgi:hypothetical protein
MTKPGKGARTMADLQITLTSQESEYLIGVLETALKETRIEEHRTRTPSYRQHVQQHEVLLTGLLKKLGQKT